MSPAHASFKKMPPPLRVSQYILLGSADVLRFRLRTNGFPERPNPRFGTWRRAGGELLRVALTPAASPSCPSTRSGQAGRMLVQIRGFGGWQRVRSWLFQKLWMLMLNAVLPKLDLAGLVNSWRKVKGGRAVNWFNSSLRDSEGIVVQEVLYS